MKAIHRVAIGVDLVNLVAVQVPAGEIAGLHLEYSDQLYFHFIAADDDYTVERSVLFAGAPDAGDRLSSALLDSTDLTGAEYLGYALGVHAWLLPA